MEQFYFLLVMFSIYGAGLFLFIYYLVVVLFGFLSVFHVLVGSKRFYFFAVNELGKCGGMMRFGKWSARRTDLVPKTPYSDPI